MNAPGRVPDVSRQQADRGKVRAQACQTWAESHPVGCVPGTPLPGVEQTRFSGGSSNVFAQNQ